MRGAAGGVSTSGIQLDTYLDSDSGGASSSDRGLLLSSIPEANRFLVLGSLTGQPSPVQALLGVSGLCLNAPFARIAFGVAGGTEGLAMVESTALTTQGDAFLAGLGTVHLQALCFPPTTVGAPTWTNAVSLMLP